MRRSSNHGKGRQAGRQKHVYLPVSQVSESAEEGTEVTIAGYVQAKQSWWDNKATVYLQDDNGAYFLYELLESCVGLMYRQPFFANFEDILHQKAASQEPMSAKIITDLYMDLNQKYYGESITMDELVGHSCFYVPHFYYNYYVYKYTLGMTVALAIVSRILSGDEKQKEAINLLKGV